MAQAQGLDVTPANKITPEKIREGIDVEINGRAFRHTGDPEMPLLWYLRDVLRLTGTKFSGEHGLGGADLVLVNNKLVAAVTVAVKTLQGKKVTTVEGLAAPDGKLHPLQQAFVDEDAIGCGYCTPGWLMASVDLLNRHPQPNDNDIDQLPNLCRCGCQTRVRRAIKRAAMAIAGGKA
ncbi:MULTISPECIES: (2Fe-2S)-binding protein [Dyella]|uniref:(2Fe-2S)-binding protein n=2 Tax=Dyella TaxID=231454 RepID=A0A4R0YP86_9GAMM|nr:MULTISPECIES: (2Fe-2S)-binding protein [Dyella]TBR37095.1 (2Fe-2S)-binding protein [Dyella terrae]TCI07815.1 (2Fe-2S)-binding protein [Dyella soli]